MRNFNAEREQRRPRYWYHLIRVMWSYHPWLSVATLITGVLGGAAVIATVALINDVIHATDDLTYYLLLFVLVSIGGVVARVIAGIIPAYMIREISTRLRIAVSRNIANTPLAQVESRGEATILTLLTNDVPKITGAMGRFPDIWISGIVLLCGAVYLAYLSPVGFAITLLGVAIGIMVCLWLLGKGMSFARKNRDEFNTFNTHSHNLVYGIKQLILNETRRRWFQRAGIEFSARRLAGLDFGREIWFVLAGNVEAIATCAIVSSVVFVSVHLGAADPKILSGFVLVYIFLLGPIGRLIDAAPDIAEATIAAERLAEVGVNFDQKNALSVSAKHTVSTAGKQAINSWSRIELRNIMTNYSSHSSDNEFVLGPINLEVKPGEILWITGGNGSGKSTLAKVLAGLYAPTAGSILLDGQSVESYDDAVYKRLFSVVFYDFRLFEHIVGEGGDDLLDAASKYLSELNLSDKVKIQGRRLSTTTALSTGQRRRVALVLACLEDRPIYILDEMAADQDPQFKNFFYKSFIQDLRDRGKCVIIISHDDHFFHLTDYRLVLEDGKIVERHGVQSRKHGQQ